MLLPKLAENVKTILLKLYQDSSRFFYQDPYKSVEEEWGLEWQGQGQY